MNSDGTFLFGTFIVIFCIFLGFYSIYKAYKGYGIQKPGLIFSGPLSEPKKTSPLQRIILGSFGVFMLVILIVVPLIVFAT